LGASSRPVPNLKLYLDNLHINQLYKKILEVIMRPFLAFFCIIAATSCTTRSNKYPAPADAKALGKELMNNLPGIFSLDTENKENLGDYEVPPIRNGNWVIGSNPISLIDSFAQETSTIATLFVKVGNEFVRILTTEPNEQPGNILSHSHPAYPRLIGEFRYTNQITLAGEDYMADYDVFRDRPGRVIGAYLVAIPLTAVETTGETPSNRP
jgi:methyl-accepting chemotaxis protein